MEIKASISGWPDYMITSTGVVLSYKGKGRVERVLKVHNGEVSLRRGGRTYTRSVRSLMELAYLTPPTRTRCNAGHLLSANRMPSGRCRRCHAQAVARWRRKRATATRT